jgi:hypothetical protein
VTYAENRNPLIGKLAPDYLGLVRFESLE